MTHADSLALPPHLPLADFYQHASTTLEALLTPSSPGSGENSLITCCANASSLLFGLFENYDRRWGKEAGKRVNWCGFYLIHSLLIRRPLSPSSDSTPTPPKTLLLGPFHGRPACSFVSLTSRIPGVCAASFLSNSAQLVPDVEARPGHIACDGVTRSELVLPLRNDRGEVVGVLDLDCEALEGFDEEDRQGLEEFVRRFEQCVDWSLS